MGSHLPTMRKQTGLEALTQLTELRMLNLDAAEVGDGMAASCAQVGTIC